MESPGTLSVATYTEEGCVVVRFRDSGPGVPDDIKENIFEPNFTTKNKNQKFGLGLGLAISSEIVQKHGGDIRVGDAPGGGAEFRVLLPSDPGREG